MACSPAGLHRVRACPHEIPPPIRLPVPRETSLPEPALALALALALATVLRAQPPCYRLLFLPIAPTLRSVTLSRPRARPHHRLLALAYVAAS